jgi:hypothetical protein
VKSSARVISQIICQKVSEASRQKVGALGYGRFVERPFGGLRAGFFRERLEEIYSEG